MEKENLKNIIKEKSLERHRILCRWRYHIIKHPEDNDKYIYIIKRISNGWKKQIRRTDEIIKEKNK